MPELPEVETARKKITAIATGQVIQKIQVLGDTIVFSNVAPTAFAKKLKGRTVHQIHRHGKYLWWEMDTPPHPVFHLGMTGHFASPGLENIELESGAPVGDHWPPRFWKVHMEFENGQKLAMTNARRFGRIMLFNDPLTESAMANMGFDPLTQPIPTKEFCERLMSKKAVLKGLLLNQAFIAGVGNWMADEICYQAKVAPQRKCNSLSLKEAKAVYKALLKIVDKACSVNADKKRFPKSWLFHHRWGKDENAKTSKGEVIVFDTVGGRTTAWVPSKQL
jgi:formamidopyrimidine-DNA glycosylase